MFGGRGIRADRAAQDRFLRSNRLKKTMLTSTHETIPQPLRQIQPSKGKVLLVDEANDIVAGVESLLALRGYAVDAVSSVSEGLELVARKDYLAVILEMNMWKEDWLSVLREFRDATNSIIIVSTENQDEYDRILSLEMAADDYLVRPYSPRELVARMHARARQQERTLPAKDRRYGLPVRLDGRVTADPRPQVSGAWPQGKFTLPGLVFNADGTDLMTTAGAPVALTRLERELFRLFIENHDSNLSKNFISSRIYNTPDASGLRSRLTMLVSRLRSKLQEHSGERLIVCPHNKGYKLNVAPRRID